MSIPPPSSGLRDGVSDAAGVLAGAGRDRLAGVRRVVWAADARGVEPARLDAALRTVVTAFLAVPAARLVVVVARRLVGAARVPEPCAIWRACLVRPSIRFRTLLTSARVLAFLTCACSCLIATRAVLSASLSRLSNCRRRSGGTRLSASLSARRPTLTARPTRPDRLAARLLFAMHDLHQDGERSA
jgi:hypothetical protein